jgi:hypothetical protein
VGGVGVVILENEKTKWQNEKNVFHLALWFPLVFLLSVYCARRRAAREVKETEALVLGT